MIQYVQATVADIPEMARYRIRLFEELGRSQPADRVAELILGFETYFNRAIPAQEYIGWLAKDEGTLVGTGGFVTRQQPGNFKNPSGRTAYIMNIYTVPAYRKQGICKAILERVMEHARQIGIDAFELHASRFGEPIYQKAGFTQHTEPTYRKYEFYWPEVQPK